MKIVVKVAEVTEKLFAADICQEIESSAKARGTGIAKRSVEYIESKIESGRAVIAKTEQNEFAGFCYIETFGHGKYVANSGLIVASVFRNQGLASAIKKKAFELSRALYPEAKLFGLTTNCSVMSINSDLGYKPVTYNKLTDDENFWNGCKSCVNYPTLMQKEMKNCICTAMIFDPDLYKNPIVKNIEISGILVQ